MLNALLKWSLANRMVVLVLGGILLVVGIDVTRNMPIDVFPDLTAPTVTILVEGPGMAPEEMETLVTLPIETAVNGSTGVRRVRSASAVGIAVVWVEFEYDVDIYRARQTVTERLSTVTGKLPPSIRAPVLAPVSSIMGEIMFVSLTSDRHDSLALWTMATTNVRRQILTVEGVSQVVPIGGDEKQYQVVLSPDRLRAFGVSLAEVADVLGESNENVSAGILVQGGRESLIQGFGRFRDLDDIRSVVVKIASGQPVTIARLGDVRVGPALKRGTGAAARRDADGTPIIEPAVILAIQKQPGANTLELTRRLDDMLDDTQRGLPAGMHINKQLFRQASFIRTSVDNTVEALRDGSIMVILTVLVFLGSMRSSVITLLAIPLSLVVAILVLKLCNASINTMTLGGLAIAIGLLVDDAIIDVENILRRLRINASLPEAQRQSALAVVFRASAEVRAIIMIATMIIILVFLPLFFLSGVEGRLLKPLGVAFTVALGASLIVALTVTPALSYYLLPNSKTVLSSAEPRIVSMCKRAYAVTLDWSMKHVWAVVIPTVLLFCVAVASSTRLGRNFLPDFNEGALIVSAVTVPGTSLEQSDALARMVGNVLMSHPEVVAYGRRTGRAEEDEHVMGVEATEFEVTLDMDAHQPRRSKAELLTALRSDLKSVPGVQVSFGQPISHRIDHMLSGTQANIAIKVFGPDLPELRLLARRIEARIEDIPGIADLNVEQQIDIPTLRVHFDRQAIARHGAHISDIALALDATGRGHEVTQVLEGQYAFDLVIRLGDPDRVTPEHIRGTLIRTHQGAVIPLKGLADVFEDRAPNFISREDVRRKIVVSCNVAGRDLAGVVADIQHMIDTAIDVPDGYDVRLGGQFATAQETVKRLALLGALVIFGIGALLHIAFRSSRDALIIMVNLPLALIGAVGGVFVSGGTQSVASVIGFIAVFGIAARNGIMMVSHIRHLQRFEGVTDFAEAVRRGALERLAPILMTALSAGLALIPLAFGADEPGKEILTPMAIVILGGLLTSTFLNMIVIPTLFVRLAKPVPAEPPQSAEDDIGAITHGLPAAPA